MTDRQQHLYHMIAETAKFRIGIVNDHCVTGEDRFNLATAFLNEAVVILVSAFGQEYAASTLQRAADAVSSGGGWTQSLSDYAESVNRGKRPEPTGTK